MAIVGLGLGAVGAWSQGAYRVFMTTLAIPLALVVTRIWFPEKDSPWYFGYLMIDLSIVAVTALSADWLVGMKLGHTDKKGYREDLTPHEHEHDTMNEEEESEGV